MSANFQWAWPVGFQLDTEEGASYIPGFVEALIGLKQGQTHSFDLTFPQTWQQEALRGLLARFTVSYLSSGDHKWQHHLHLANDKAK
jgi:hypothetical protein